MSIWAGKHKGICAVEILDTVGMGRSGWKKSKENDRQAI